MFRLGCFPTTYNWRLLVSASSSLPTLFAQSLFHKKPHHDDDNQSTTFSSTLQYAGPEVSHEGSRERALQLHYRAFPVSLLHVASRRCLNRTVTYLVST